MTITLAVDVGQTSSRLLLTYPDGRVERWSGNGGRAGKPVEAALLDLIETTLAAREHATPPLIDTVSAGLTGLQGRPARAPEVLARLRERWRTSRVILADDALTSYIGALGLRPGVVVAAGTGAVTLATDGANRHARVDGHGYLLGDLGSGYWVGRQGLEAAFKSADGRDGSPLLLSLAAAHYGDPATLPVRLAADPARVSRIASFAHQVRAAAIDGDRVAMEIWREAAEQLADAVAAAARSVGLTDDHLTVSWTGQLFDAGPLLLDPFVAAVRARLHGATLCPPAGSSLEGALDLANLDPLPPLEPLLATAVAA
jgi:N-acetylglucosamine kinase-like BadF-type ATPase